MTRDWKAELEQLGIDSVIAHDLLFKAQLGIGESAYKSLKTGNITIKAWNLSAAVVGGGALAASPLVATTFFPAGGILGLLGLGAAATPIGWVIAAGALSGMTWFGIQKKLDRMSADKTVVVPKYINTPLDLLAVGIFELIAPLALKIAFADDKFTADESGRISGYFSDRWGYNPKFVQAGLQFYSEALSAPAMIRAKLEKDGMSEHAHLIKDFDEEDYAKIFVAFVEANKDCNHQKLSKNVVGFLRELVRADSEVHPREEETLERIGTILRNKSFWDGRPDIFGWLDSLWSKKK